MTAKWQYKQAYEGVLEEVRSLKAENEKLRACLGDGCADCAVGMGEYADSLCDPLKVENAKLRELCADMSHDVFVACEMCGSGGDVRKCGDCNCQVKRFYDRMQTLGIEVE